jgi:hypothetical protein
MKTKTEPLIHQKVANWLYNILQFIAGVPNEWLSESKTPEESVSTPKLTVKRLPHHGQINS